jgi:O-antigen/teichoic acid export membrane protein
VSSGTNRSVRDAGAARNTALQFLTQMAGVVFTGVLTLYLVRALGASGYGRYSLAVAIGALIVLPAGLGLPMSVGRYVADHRADSAQIRAILGLGLRLQVPAAALASLGLFALAGTVARAYGIPALVWPLRWIALAVFGQTLFNFLAYAVTSLRQSGIGLSMAIVESAAETISAIALVLAGAGAAGAAAGKAIGYALGAAGGLLLTSHVLGGLRRNTVITPPKVRPREVIAYAGATFVVDLGYIVIAQLDILLIGFLLTSRAVGSFSAVTRIITVLGYLGVAIARGVAPRLVRGSGAQEARIFGQSLRYLVIAQGLVLAPMIVWAEPIVRLLLGEGYPSSPQIMRILSVMAFASAPATVISLSVTYLGAARRRVGIVLVTLALGLLSTYVLLRVVGLAGAAIADDLVTIAYVAANLWICAQLIDVDVRSHLATLGRTLLAALAMSLVLFAVGTSQLTVAQWILGGAAGLAAYAGTLVLSRELPLAELRALPRQLWAAMRTPPAGPASTIS